MAVDIIARALAAKALNGGSGGSGGSGSSSDVFEVSQLTDYEVGGIPAGTDLNGKTWQQIFLMMLYGSVPVPTLTDPSITVVLDEREEYYEVGTTATITGTITFDRGSISPAYGTSGYRSGLPTAYRINSVEYTTSSVTWTFEVDVVVVEGDNGLSIEVDYAEGEQPLDAAGDAYDSPLPAGTLYWSDDAVLVGAYPLYVSTSEGDFVPMEIANQFNSDGEVVVEVPGELSKEHKQAVGFIASTPDIVGIQQYDESRDLWDWIYGSPTESLTAFNQTTQTVEVNGVQAEYRVFTNNSVLFGRRKLKFFTQLPSSD